MQHSQVEQANLLWLVAMASKMFNFVKLLCLRGG